MRRLVLRFLQAASVFLNQFCSLCWLIPYQVADDERIVRAIYSPVHLDKKLTRLRSSAYDPPPGTDELSVMRLEYLGTRASKKHARRIENPKKNRTYRGFAVLRVKKIRDFNMSVDDSRQYYSGHADIRLMLDALKNRQANEPLSAADGKRLKDLKDYLLASSRYVPDPKPTSSSWRGGHLDPP